jgi:hypothetical protein
MINTGGWLTGKNEVALAFDKKRRIGVRLMVSWQLGWSAFGGRDCWRSWYTCETRGERNGQQREIVLNGNNGDSTRTCPRIHSMDFVTWTGSHTIIIYLMR